MRCTVVVAALLVAAAAPAHADGARFGWVDDTDVAAEHRPEIELQFFEKDGVGDPEKGMPPVDQTTLGVSTVLGVTDRLELGLQLEMAYREQPLAPSFNGVDQAGVELRWRLASRDPARTPFIVPLIRIAARRLITDREAFRLEAAVVGTMQLGRVRVALDAGALLFWRWQQESFESRPAAGVSIAVTPALGVGAEVYGEIGWDDDRTVDWLSAGPSLSWTPGACWLAFAAPVGLLHADIAPRLNVGFAF